jgi:YceI-like domain
MLNHRFPCLFPAAGVALTLALALAGCSTPAPPPVPLPAPAVVASAAPLPVTGRLAIDPQASLIAITVRRGGPLARLGHDHVVAARTLAGEVDAAGNRATLRFRVDALTVDEPGLRRIAGLDTQPSAEAIEGTRRNMLTRVLDAERYPWVEVTIERHGTGAVAAAITLHGVTRRYDVPATIAARDDSLRATGTLTLRQTDFGIVPFSVLGGAMAVQDALELRFDIVARRRPPI